MIRMLAAGLAALLMLAAAPSLAAVDAAKVAESGRATNAFLALAAGSEKSGEVPRATDPAAGALLDKILNTAAIGEETPSLGEIQDTSALMENGTKVMIAYMLAGTGAATLDALGSDPAAEKKANENMVTYAPEIGRIYDFTARMEGALSDSVASFTKTASKDQMAIMQDGIAQMQGGLLQTFGGILTSLADASYDPAWRLARAKVLDEVGGKVAGVLQPAQAKTLGDQALAIAGAADDAALKAALTAFAGDLGAGK